MQAIGDLNGVSRRIPNPHMIIRPLQRREALTSSSMEGTHASPDDLVLLESDSNDQVDESAREVLNYIRALESATKMLETLPISHRMIRETHIILLSGLSKWRGANKRPGEYNIHHNFIGGQSIEQARFIPPPPQTTTECMDAMERYINSESSSLPPIIDAALIHYQFETIHPFADGNGRVGRILIPMFLMSKGVIQRPIIYMSPFIERNKDKYIDLMYAISRSGDWLPWAEFFLDAVKETCKDTSKTIDRLLDLQSDFREKAARISRSNVAIKLVDSLFERPVLTVPLAAKIANVTYPPALNAINKLVEAGILSEIPGVGQPKKFVSRDVVLISSGLDRETGVTSDPF